ncbi:MAG: RluA family pseudouridine synthase [Eubacteriales bacterium]|nr:RluA family pseudouridine synthase [Eubacteriales bacterium]
MIEIIVTSNDDNQRLDRFLKKYLSEAPLSMIYRMIRKDIKVNGRRVGEDTMLAAEDVVTFYISPEQLAALTKKKKRVAAKRQFTIAYEDEDVIVVGKPFGLLVHGDSSEKKDTLANQVVDYLIREGSYSPRTERTFTPSPVHRLDRNTTGLVVFGKNSPALRTLSFMLRENGVRKFYQTIVVGSLSEELHLKGKLHKDPAENKSRVFDAEDSRGKPIETIVRPVYTGPDYSVAEVELVTGRSHQIRAHLQSAGYPLICDTKYGWATANRVLQKKIAWSTQLLHAGRLMIVQAPPPLEHLNGLEITTPVPPFWKEIQLALFDKEILHNGIE